MCLLDSWIFRKYRSSWIYAGQYFHCGSLDFVKNHINKQISLKSNNLDYYLENSLVSSMFATNQLFSWLVNVIEHDLFIISERLQLAAAAWVFQFSQGFCFDLPDSLTGYFELLSDFFQGMFIAISQAKSHL